MGSSGRQPGEGSAEFQTPSTVSRDCSGARDVSVNQTLQGSNLMPSLPTPVLPIPPSIPPSWGEGSLAQPAPSWELPTSVHSVCNQIEARSVLHLPPASTPLVVILKEVPPLKAGQVENCDDLINKVTHWLGSKLGPTSPIIKRCNYGEKVLMDWDGS